MSCKLIEKGQELLQPKFSCLRLREHGAMALRHIFGLVSDLHIGLYRLVSLIIGCIVRRMCSPKLGQASFCMHTEFEHFEWSPKAH